ncbi:helix-turn-helix transcriptional regulator [Microbulbifer sp. TRSA001]|uniref:helix-turn-helix transcriptional regulator n=1 Tax=Microbulbifer sp. TRSA001 TaxID=3243381 RepID=UPI00403A57BD
MLKLKQLAKQLLEEGKSLPFSVYSSYKEQNIFNVPIVNPTLICVLDGCKELGGDSQKSCSAGEFIFLSNSPKVDMRNIPVDSEYFALLIEFEYKDFDRLIFEKSIEKSYFTGEVGSTLEITLHQFMEWGSSVSSDLWHIRRQEILQTLFYLGYQEVASVLESASVSQKLYRIISENPAADLRVDMLASKLAMSESTLRRKLNGEGTSVKVIIDDVRLGFGLHLLQTTFEPVGRISERCGYKSQSRFADRFKRAFGITPIELRKTRVNV